LRSLIGIIPDNRFTLEDAVVCFAAKRIKADYIITQNIADFINSPVPAMTPTNFIDKFFVNV